MSQTLTLPQHVNGFIRKKWTIDECRSLVDNGLIDPCKYELIEGDIVLKGRQNRDHVYAVSRIIAVLSAIFGGDSVQSRAQIGIGEIDEFNDPEPDVAVLRG